MLHFWYFYLIAITIVLVTKVPPRYTAGKNSRSLRDKKSNQFLEHFFSKFFILKFWTKKVKWVEILHTKTATWNDFFFWILLFLYKIFSIVSPGLLRNYYNISKEVLKSDNSGKFSVHEICYLLIFIVSQFST